MAVLLEKYVLPILAAATVLMLITNPLKLEVLTRIISGMVLLVLAILVSFDLHRRTKNKASSATPVDIQQIIHSHSAPAPPPKSTLDFPQTKPSPREISEYVEKLTPYEQEKPISVYNGVKVSWVASFSDVTSYGAGSRQHFGWDTDIIFSSESSYNDLRIICGINIEEVPRFKSLKRGTEVGIKGTISGVFPHAIRLKNSEFTFFDLAC